MIPDQYQLGSIVDRARKSVREIVVALALTLAAVVFVFAAMHTNTPETASIAAPQNSPAAQAN